MSNVTKLNPNGVILYEGPSLMDGAPIVVIAAHGNGANAVTRRAA